MDVDALLQNHGEDAPSGDDLEYHADFTNLTLAAQPGEERQVGDEVLPAEDPNYKEVAQLAEAVLEQSHDLRAAIYYGEAQLRLSGFRGFAEATTYVRRCLSEFWDSCHPQLDEDDGDPMMRRNVVLDLTDGRRILAAVRRVPLTKSQMFGGMSLRHVAVAEGAITPPDDMESIPDLAQIAAAFQDTDPDELAEIASAVAQALEDVEEISRVFDDRTGGEGPNLEPLLTLLQQADARVRQAVEGDEGVQDNAGASPEEVDGSGGAVPVAAGAATVAQAGGGISSPADVQNALDRIIAYYHRYEPSSPLPLLLERAKRLVSADFLTIMKDMAPSGVENVHLIGGIEEDDDD
ncbi:MAG: type VI secretion system protein TssA [Rhodobacteraceae bacterium]|nr:type VI secretion system protein TssA [Paracoccaceae bacterium]